MEKNKQKSKRFIRLCAKYGVDPEKVPEILSFEVACKARKVNPKKLPIVTGIPLAHRKHIIANYKLTIIAEALREGKKVNYNDASEYKRNAMFKVKANAKNPSGFGLSYCDSAIWLTSSAVGVRFAFPNNWDATIFFGKHFIQLHKDWHLYT